jgi:hypothetical protein
MPNASSEGTQNETTCDSDAIEPYQPGQSSLNELPCLDNSRTSKESAEARAYLIETAKPGYTMTRQGPELAIERLHPEFVVRLANAFREARDAGLPFAGIFSAYRPPAFGVGGFADKFYSLHSYGLAVDVHGIGRPGSVEAQRWHEIAARHGVVCPYGPHNRAEWNHCQPTSLKMIVAKNPLRETITAQGPLSLETMFEVGNSMIHNPESVAEPTAEDMPEPEIARENSGGKRRLARFKAKRIPAADSAGTPVRKDAEASVAKPARALAKRAAKVAAKRAARFAANNKIKSRRNGYLAIKRGTKEAARLAGKKTRAGPQLAKPASIMVEERRRGRKSGSRG